MLRSPGSALAMLLLSGAALSTGHALISAAVAGPSAASIHATLHDDSGWSYHAERNGVTVYEKPISALGTKGYKGVMTIDVDPDLLFSIICDTEGHLSFSPSLAASKVIARNGDRYDYYQVAETPALVPISDRFWFNQAHMRRDVTKPGHHLRTWAPIDPGLYPETFAAVQSRFPDAVLVAVNYGSWEIMPQADGTNQLTYHAVTHPGGNVPTSVFETLAARSLPDNMLTFVNQARARAGG